MPESHWKQELFGRSTQRSIRSDCQPGIKKITEFHFAVHDQRTFSTFGTKYHIGAHFLSFYFNPFSNRFTLYKDHFSHVVLLLTKPLVAHFTYF